jgi:hypothetical protein
VRLGRVETGREVWKAEAAELLRGVCVVVLAEDLGNMFQFKQEFEQSFCAARKLETSRSLNPALQTFAQWLATHDARIPLA